MSQIGNHTNMVIEEDLVRHLILNKLRTIKQLYRGCGEMVIACDGKNNWRKKVFPFYKANRKKTRDDSELDWKAIFNVLNKIRDEIKDNFPYIVIEIDTAEADDIIGSLAAKYGVDLNTDSTESIVIISGDKDFVQLQRFSNVKQYDPVRKKNIEHHDPISMLKEHIIRGDTGDGVPNFLSPDNSLVDHIRQKKITEKKLEQWLAQPVIEFEPELQRNFMRNAQMIDLGYTPKTIFNSTITEYEEQKKSCNAKRSKLFNYFITHKLKNLMENIGDF